MARHSGKEGIVKVGANAVLAVRRWSIRASSPIDDTTAMKDDWQTHVGGIPGWTGSIDVLFDPSDSTGQNALTAGASVTLGLYSDGDENGKTYFTGTATITERGVDAAHQGAVTGNFSFTGNGALSQSVVGA